MINVILQSGAFTLGMALLAILSVMLLLRWVDKVTGQPFSEIRKVIITDAMASAIYYGLRFLGVCLLVGKLFS